MFTILFALFLMVVGITVVITYSAHQSIATSNGTITFNTPIYTITLDNANATTNGTSTIYEKYVIGTFTNSQCTTQMTTSTNPITKPARAYTISYNSNGGSSCSNQTATYTFNGYYTASTGGVQMIGSNGYITSNFTSTYFSSNTTLRAQWSSASITLPTPTYTGYTFGGWYGESALTNKIGDGGDSYTPTSNKTLYAKWTANAYTISYSLSNGTNGNNNPISYTASSSQQTKTVNEPTLADYNFNGWAISWTDSTHSGSLPTISGTTLTIPANCYGNITLGALWRAQRILVVGEDFYINYNQITFDRQYTGSVEEGGKLLIFYGPSGVPQPAQYMTMILYYNVADWAAAKTALGLSANASDDTVLAAVSTLGIQNHHYETVALYQCWNKLSANYDEISVNGNTACITWSSNGRCVYTFDQADEQANVILIDFH